MTVVAGLVAFGAGAVAAGVAGAAGAAGAARAGAGLVAVAFCAGAARAATGLVWLATNALVLLTVASSVLAAGAVVAFLVTLVAGAET